MNNTKLSASESLRNKANKAFKLALNLSFSSRHSHLAQALELYNQAIIEASNNDELASATKNVGVCSYEIYKYYSRSNAKSEFENAKFHIKSAFSGLNKAFNMASSKSIDWKQDLLKRMKLYLENFRDYLIDLKDNASNLFISSLNELNDQENRVLMFEIYLKLGQFFFYRSVKECENENYKLANQFIHECPFYIMEANKLEKELRVYLNENYAENPLIELENDFNLQLVIIQAKMNKKKADLLQSTLINESNTLCIELAWETIDLYRLAIWSTKNKDLELEAECLSIIGMIYEKILNIKPKSKTYYYQCFHLVESLKPKTFNSCSWFIRCQNAIQKFQNETVQVEEKKKEEEKAKVLSKIKSDLEKIRSKRVSLSKAEFLKFVYKNYKPKNFSHILNASLVKEDDNDKLSKAYKYALTHYHPDKNLASDHGFEWYFIAEEISKELNNNYMHFKNIKD